MKDWRHRGKKCSKKKLDEISLVANSGKGKIGPCDSCLATRVPKPGHGGRGWVGPARWSGLGAIGRGRCAGEAWRAGAGAAGKERRSCAMAKTDAGCSGRPGRVAGWRAREKAGRRDAEACVRGGAVGAPGGFGVAVDMRPREEGPAERTNAVPVGVGRRGGGALAWARAVGRDLAGAALALRRLGPPGAI